MTNSALNYEFEDYRLLTNERLLLRNGTPVSLKPKVLETLLALVQGHNRVLSKDELIGKIWEGNVVEESNLTQYIFTLRKVFGEGPKDHRFILTIPGHGYRFISKVNEISSNGAAPKAKTPTREITTVAVLPLRILSASEAGRYLGLAIADALITQLGTNNAISVQSTGAVVKYTETERDPVSVGAELDVDAVVSGTLHSIGETIRVNIQIIHVRTSETLWASKFETRSDNFFALQDEISDKVASALHIKLQKARSAAKALADSEIYQAYLKYRFFWETRTESGLLLSLSGSRKIVAADPTYPLGYVGIADSLLLLGHHLFRSPADVLPLVDQAVQQALELSPNLAEAHGSLADLSFVRREWQKAEELYRKTIDLNPNYSSNRHWYGWFLMATSRFDESLEQIHHAQTLDPNSLYLGTVCGVPWYYKGEYERALKQFRMILEVNPDFNRARYYLALALFYSGDPAAAIAECERVVAAEPIQQTIALLGNLYGQNGRYDDARRMLTELDQIASRRYVSPYVRAWILSGLGEKDMALTELERSFVEGTIWLVWMKIDMLFQDLRREPRFQRLVDKMNLPT